MILVVEGGKDGASVAAPGDGVGPDDTTLVEVLKLPDDQQKSADGEVAAILGESVDPEEPVSPDSKTHKDDKERKRKKHKRDKKESKSKTTREKDKHHRKKDKGHGKHKHDETDIEVIELPGSLALADDDAHEVIRKTEKASQ